MKYGFKVDSVFRVNRKPKVHMVELNDGSHLRLDIYKKYKKLKVLKKAQLQKLLYSSGVNVPKVIGIEENVRHKYIWKISEWIEGERIENYWDDPTIIEKCGEQIAKINSVKIPKSNDHICLGDFTPLNAIVTSEKKVYIIDLSIYLCKNVNVSVYKTLVTGLKNRKRVEWFLNGYKKIRSTERILKLAEKKNWKWKECILQEEDQEDVCTKHKSNGVNGYEKYTHLISTKKEF